LSFWGRQAGRVVSSGGLKMRREDLFLLVLFFFSVACDQAESRFNEAQKCERFGDTNCAIKNYMEILTNFSTSQYAQNAADRVYEIVKSKTRDFTRIEKEELNLMKTFSEKLPDSKLGKFAKEYFANEELKQRISESLKPLLDKMLIEDYEGIDSYFVSGKADEKFLNAVAMKDRRSGMSVESFTITDVMPKGADGASIVLSRREWHPATSVTGEVKYLIHLKKSQDKWQIAGFELAPVHSLKK
jgi:hypothetical protein